MKISDKILELIDFPNSLEFSVKLNKLNIDSQGICSSPHIVVNGEFIDYFQHKKKEREESWTSLDIIIKQDKIVETLNILSNFLLKEKLIELEEFEDFKKVENNHTFFMRKSTDDKRLEIVKSENKLALLITKII